jgi:hypothetical protein
MPRVGIFIMLLAATIAHARSKASRSVDVVLSQGSSRINGIELLSGPKVGVLRFFSLRAAEKVLRAAEDTYVPRGVRVYAWRSVGIHLQRGWRGPEKDKLFKLQVYFDDDYDRFVDKQTGAFTGTVRVEGVEIHAGTLLQSVRPQLESIGFQVTEDTAEKGEIKILAINPERRIDRIEQWCL